MLVESLTSTSDFAPEKEALPKLGSSFQNYEQGFSYALHMPLFSEKFPASSGRKHSNTTPGKTGRKETSILPNKKSNKCML